MSEEHVKEREKEKIKEPPQYNVFIINDDYTPIDFVIFVLIEFFSKDFNEATRIAEFSHNNGEAFVEKYGNKDIAETKVQQTMIYSREAGYPLMLKAIPN